MVSSMYEAILQEVGKILGISLFPDANNSCQVKLINGVQMQLELNKRGDHLVIGVDLGTVPPGRYRVNLLREALRVNGASSPRQGVIAFSPKADKLVLFLMLRTDNLNGEKVAFMIGPLSEKALVWKEAITRGDLPAAQSGGGPAAGGTKLFGLR